MEDLMIKHDHLARLPYSNCNTRIVSLKNLDIPEKATEKEYVQIYENYLRNPSGNGEALCDAVQSIKYGIAPPVAFPTETVYGLGADATNEPAVAGIFAAKGRPIDNPLIVHAASATHVEHLTGVPIPKIYKTLVEQFWPGPLTILIPAPQMSKFAKNVHPGQPTMGFRVPESKYARFFIAVTDRPIAAPSANSSGKPSPTTAQHVMDDLQGKINFILDGGPCDVGVESTVVDGIHDPPLILRPGGVSQEELIIHGKKFNNAWANTAIGYRRNDEINGEKETELQKADLKVQNRNEHFYTELNGAPRAPGMKYRHYAPQGRLILFSEAAIAAKRPYETVSTILSKPEHQAQECRIGIISCRWPIFAGLLQLPGQQTKTNTQITEFQVQKDETKSSSPEYMKIISKSPYAKITSTTIYNPDPNSIIQHQLFDVHIGPDISTLAQSLFGILRLFDDLKCDIILAETVSHQDQYQSDFRGSVTSSAKAATAVLLDAVADRLEKAAGERIDR